MRLIANNAEIDIIWDKFQEMLEPLRKKMNQAMGEQWEEWEIPRETDDSWPEEARSVHARWWEERIKRQKEIDASIAAKADYEYLYDKPYEDNKKVRVAGPFTVESLSPHRVELTKTMNSLMGWVIRRGYGPGRFCPDDPGKSEDCWGAAGP